jgi:hypothetical protein
MTDETRARFLAGIATQVPAERVAEVHLFGAIRQGGQESGVAVVAVHREPATNDVEQPPDVAAENTEEQCEVFNADDAGTVPAVDTRPTRYTVYTARFRHTLKGPDRGKWELAVTEEADAPLLTVDAVVRGVSRRAGETDETIRLSGDEFRAELSEPARE